jgi:hypothetical protein
LSPSSSVSHGLKEVERSEIMPAPHGHSSRTSVGRTLRTQASVPLPWCTSKSTMATRLTW